MEGACHLVHGGGMPLGPGVLACAGMCMPACACRHVQACAGMCRHVRACPLAQAGKEVRALPPSQHVLSSCCGIF
eukprot:365222-Chlamydomonas_euryale.AAC.12